MFIRVAVPVPGLDLLTYAVPDGVAAPVVGARVVVPLGIAHRDRHRRRAGADGRRGRRPRRHQAAQAGRSTTSHSCRPTSSRSRAGRPSTTPPAPARRSSRCCRRRTRGERADAHKTRRVAAITAAGLGALEDRAADATAPRGTALTAKQREALDVLSGAPAGLPTAALAARGCRRTRSRGWPRTASSVVRRERVERDPFDACAGRRRRRGRRPPAHERAGSRARAAGVRWPRRATFQVALLHGVTGSGKTEIYLRLAAAVRDAGPPRPDARARDRADAGRGGALPRRVRRARRHPAQRPVGRRAPRPVAAHPARRDRRRRRHALGGVRAARAISASIIVDEEHDGSYKQEESPRYNGRDVAIVRGAARRARSSCSARRRRRWRRTSNAMTGRVRARRARAPRARPAARRGDRRRHARGVRRGRAGRRAQPRARRGDRGAPRAPRAGARAAQPPRVRDGRLLPPVRRDARLSELQRVARRPRRRRGAPRALPLLQLLGARARPCPNCAGPYLEQAGFGTERVEAEVRRAAPGARVARLDRDADPEEGRAHLAPRALSRRRDRRPRRHADDRQGPRLPARHAGRRRLGRRRPRPRRLPRVRAHVPAADAGRRPRGPRRAAGRGDRPDALPRPLQHPARVPAGLPGVLREASCSSAARCAIRRSCRSSTRSCAPARSRARWTMRRISRSGCGARTAAAAGCACSAPRPRRSAACAASTARSCS